MSTCRSLYLTLLVLLVLAALAACAPAAPEPADASAPTAVAPALAARPGAPATATPPSYPWSTLWPTPSPGQTDAPEPTEEPTETPPPVSTQPPTPVVTPIPTAAPPFIPFPDGTTPQPFSLYWREGDVIRTMRSDESESQLFLDPAAEFGLYLLPAEAKGLKWGAMSPNGQTLALVFSEEQSPVSSLDTPYAANIYLLDRESRELTSLLKYGVEPAWSKNGERLAYVSTETGGLRVGLPPEK